MDNLPDGTYAVTISNAPHDNWAEGTLVVATVGTHTTMTYNGQPTTHNDLKADKVGWVVELTDPRGKNCKVHFKKGHYANKKITLGTVSSPCFKEPDKDPEDEWSATSTGEPQKAAGRAY